MTFTISSSGFSTTNTFTITVGTTGSPAPVKEPAKKGLKGLKELDFRALFKGAREPEGLPPAVYGTCLRCSVSLDVEAFAGRCSVCGGLLRVG